MGGELWDRFRTGKEIPEWNALFGLLAERSDIEAPLCEECAGMVLAESSQELKQHESDLACYTRYQRAEEVRDGVSEAGEVAARIADLEAEKARLEDEIEVFEAWENWIEAEEYRMEVHQKEVFSVSAKVERGRQEFNAERTWLREEREAVDATMHRANQQLDVLRRTHSLNDAFHIWFDGHFGCINGLRLGRFPSVPVSWDEIYAAYGFAAMLMERMATMLQYEFQHFSIIPMGSFTKLCKRDDKSILEINTSRDYNLLKYFWFRRFDAAQVALLTCLAELIQFASSKDPNFRVPYRVHRDSIADLSVRLASTSEETWTRAMKFFLADLKWVLSWAAGSASSTSASNSITNSRAT